MFDARTGSVEIPGLKTFPSHSPKANGGSRLAFSTSNGQVAPVVKMQTIEYGTRTSCATTGLRRKYFEGAGGVMHGTRGGKSRRPMGNLENKLFLHKNYVGSKVYSFECFLRGTTIAVPAGCYVASCRGALHRDLGFLPLRAFDRLYPRQAQTPTN